MRPQLKRKSIDVQAGVQLRASPPAKCSGVAGRADAACIEIGFALIHVLPRRISAAIEMAMFSTEPNLLHELIKYALSDKRGPARWHITRVAMYRALERLFAEEDLPEKTCLCVSQSQALAEILGLSSAKKVITSYPDVDMLALPYGDGAFDFVISDQVLEHMKGDPFTAMAESMRVLKPGGAAVHTTCFINFLHQLPLDFWRFSEAALELLARSANAENIKTGGWGNRDAWTYMQLGYRSSKVPEVPGNPVFELARRSDKRWPVTTWVSFRKPK